MTLIYDYGLLCDDIIVVIYCRLSTLMVCY